MSARQVVHVSSGNPESGHSIELAQGAMRRWHDQGYAVVEPAEGHPEGKPCPLCASYADIHPELSWNGPQVLLPTDVGVVEAGWLDASNCWIRADGRNGTDVEFAGRHWYVSIALHAISGWGEDGNERHDSGHRHQFSDLNDGRKTIAPSYRAKIVAAIQRAVIAYTAVNHEVLCEAERNRAQHALDKANEKIAELTNALAEQMGEASLLQAVLADLPGPAGYPKGR